MLKIRNLKANINGKEILKGIDLDIPAGEVHAIMGPNGSGKSTLSQVLAGNENYEVTGGSVTYMGQELLSMNTEERALNGLFLAFQYPVEIPGISNEEFLRAAVNAGRKHRGEPELDAFDFSAVAHQKMKIMELKSDLLGRSLNVGFSGGEKKRNECFQMAMLEPKLSILDETDSGLDIDALRVVSQGVNSLRDAERSFLVITHYQRLLEYIVPDRVHVLAEGRIIKSGGKELALELEEKGYSWVSTEASL
ncbi:MAG: Fe-S cluster assembly ATPase SufC [bacterium]|nr:Fe-S cluster assembly ATPase SufC [bacterium]